jgi:hypothetical protein
MWPSTSGLTVTGAQCLPVFSLPVAVVQVTPAEVIVSRVHRPHIKTCTQHQLVKPTSHVSTQHPQSNVMHAGATKLWQAAGKASWPSCLPAEGMLRCFQQPRCWLLLLPQQRGSSDADTALLWAPRPEHPPHPSGPTPPASARM